MPAIRNLGFLRRQRVDAQAVASVRRGVRKTFGRDARKSLNGIGAHNRGGNFYGLRFGMGSVPQGNSVGARETRYASLSW